MKVLLINGPNLNMLGLREPEIYGNISLNQIQTKMREKAKKLGLELSIFQSNCEGSIINAIHDAVDNITGIIINPAGFTHTSVAIRDALALINVPIIEVHISNIYARESFRRVSITSDVVTGQISGLGYKGYLLALEAVYWLNKQNTKAYF